MVGTLRKGYDKTGVMPVVIDVSSLFLGTMAIFSGFQNFPPQSEIFVSSNGLTELFTRQKHPYFRLFPPQSEVFVSICAGFTPQFTPQQKPSGGNQMGLSVRLSGLGHPVCARHQGQSLFWCGFDVQERMTTMIKGANTGRWGVTTEALRLRPRSRLPIQTSKAISAADSFGYWTEILSSWPGKAS